MQPSRVTSLHCMLTNPGYKGIVTMNCTQHTRSHEPIISETT
ncbi:recombinase family protein [Rothia halotolerans]